MASKYLLIIYELNKIGEKQFFSDKPSRCHLNQMVKINIKIDGRNIIKCMKKYNITTVIFWTKFHNLIVSIKNVRQIQIEGYFIGYLKVNKRIGETSRLKDIKDTKTTKS